MKKETVTTFTEGPILAPLIKFALPVLFALFLQSLYGAVDLLVVGWFGTSADVSGVSTGSQILQTITNLIAALSMGITIVLGQQIGEGRGKDGGKTIGAGIKLFLIVGIIITFVSLIFAQNLASIMNAPDEAMSQTVGYLRICGGGALIIIAYNLIGSIFRGIGDSKTPLITVFIACIFNIFGDLLFVAVFGMGAMGAAIATVMAQFVSVIASLYLISKKELPFELKLSDVKSAGANIIKKIFILGGPLALSDFLVSMSFLIILAIVNAHGLSQSAGIGVAEKVCAFIMLVSSAFMQSMAAFVAQNVGAGKMKRAVETLKCGIMVSLICGIVMGLLTFFYGNVMAGVFSSDSEVVAYAWDYLKAYAIDCFLTAFLFCFVGFYNGCGMTTFVMAQSITGAVIRTIVSYIMSGVEPFTLFKVGMATPTSTVFQIALCFIAFYFFKKKHEIVDR